MQCYQKSRKILNGTNGLKHKGIKVLRFWDDEVLTNTDEVLEVISTHCFNHPPLNPLPSREG